jgi:hypothetical protein
MQYLCITATRHEPKSVAVIDTLHSGHYTLVRLFLREGEAYTQCKTVETWHDILNWYWYLLCIYSVI